MTKAFADYLIHPFDKFLSIYYVPDAAIGVTIVTILDTDIFEDSLIKTNKMS